MPRFLNRVPQGFLSLLDMKSGGENAKELGYVLQTQIDVLDFYLAPITNNVSASIASAGVGLLVSALGPAPGEVWLVRQCNAVMNAAIAAGTIAFSIGFRPQNQAGIFVGLGPESKTGGAGEAPASSSFTPCVLQPGDVLGAWISTWTVGPGNVRINAQVARLVI